MKIESLLEVLGVNKYMLRNRWELKNGNTWVTTESGDKIEFNTKSRTVFGFTTAG